MDDPNSPEAWDAIWQSEGEATWRTYPILYDRIINLIPAKSIVYDFGCGVGKLLDRLKSEKDCSTHGCDASRVAVEAARAKGHDAWFVHLNAATLDKLYAEHPTPDVYTATEVLEHLDNRTLEHMLAFIAKRGSKAIFAVPNNCMGPDEEPQHRQKWTALEFLNLLRNHFPDARVECIDDGAPRLLGICGFPTKPYKLAFTMPVKNEAADIERVLKSFRGVADRIVIGVDDLSTDATLKIAKQYADEVFEFTWEKSFSKARNLCLAKCRESFAPSDWIFMSEGHEHLEAGVDTLLNLDVVPAGVHVVEVCREDREHAWMFPWLTRARDDIFYENDVHNSLVYNENKSQVTQIPGIRTWHERATENALSRIQQRKYMNRQALTKALLDNPKDTRSCFYLANEWRRSDNTRAMEYYRRYLAMDGKNGPERYQARLSLSECLVKSGDFQEAYDVLIVAMIDDWSRNDHWLYLGDLCYSQAARKEQALRFYELAATYIEHQPTTFMWVVKSHYSWLPAQKLVSIYAELGRLEEALQWCDRTASLLPEWAPKAARDEVTLIRDSISAALTTSPTIGM